MADPSRHLDEELIDALAGRLSPDRQQAVDEHLAACLACRASYEALAWTRREVATLGHAAVPPNLVPDIRAALDQEDASSVPTPRSPLPFRRRRIPVLAAAGALAAAALVVLAVATWWTRPPLLPDIIAQDYVGVRAGTLPLTIESDRTSVLEDHLAKRLGFRTPVYDLSTLDYRVVGARANRIADRPSALSAYIGAAGDRLICEMFPGALAEMPRPDEQRTSGSVEFLIYRRGPITIVMWQSGSIVCALAGEADDETMLRMAVAKSST